MKKQLTLFQGQQIEIGDSVLTVVSIGQTRQDRSPTRRHVDIQIETLEPTKSKTETIETGSAGQPA